MLFITEFHRRKIGDRPWEHIPLPPIAQAG